MNPIGNIKQIAREKGIKLSFITNKLGLASSYFADVEHGKTKISTERLKIISEILDVSPDYLLGLTDEKKPSEKNPEGQGVDEPIISEISELLKTMNDEDKQKLLSYLHFLASEGKQ